MVCIQKMPAEILSQVLEHAVLDPTLPTSRGLVNCGTMYEPSAKSAKAFIRENNLSIGLVNRRFHKLLPSILVKQPILYTLVDYTCYYGSLHLTPEDHILAQPRLPALAAAFTKLCVTIDTFYNIDFTNALNKPLPDAKTEQLLDFAMGLTELPKLNTMKLTLRVTDIPEHGCAVKRMLEEKLAAIGEVRRAKMEVEVQVVPMMANAIILC